MQKMDRTTFKKNEQTKNTQKTNKTNKIKTTNTNLTYKKITSNYTQKKN